LKDSTKSLLNRARISWLF